jgi:hypothetical protein
MRRERPAALPHAREARAATVAAPAEDAPAFAVVPVAAAASAAGIEPLPPATLPAASRLHYEMKRGGFTGHGDIVWKPAGDRYELRLEATVGGLPVLTEISTGAVDEHGLAPLRYTDQRLRRGIEAANFQREAGKITYSGPAVEHPLPPGAQDRLSWMLQLAGVLNADPHRAAPGAEVAFFVTGARGDADTWTFRCAGVERISAAGDAIPAVKFTRAPRQTYDRLVEIWLDPAREHVPVRARFSAEANGEVFELLLRDIQPP